MEPALILPPDPDERWDLALQLGVENVVVHPLEIGDGRIHWEFDDLLLMRNAFEAAGLEVAVMEGSVPITDTTRLGQDGRDEEIEEFKQFIRDCGALGIPTICYDWMAIQRWARTSTAVRSRGGSLTTEYNDAHMRAGPPPKRAPVSADELWDALEYFLEAVVPVAEEAGVKLGLHPDDPPIQEVRSVPRIITSPDAYERVIDIVDSPSNGITFCQGNFAAMGVDIPETIHRFADRINFVHFRDVRHTDEGFVETWHDDGPTDMLAAMRAYEDAGVDAVARPDHVPTMATEANDNPGYETLGRLFAIGYMRGLREQTQA